MAKAKRIVIRWIAWGERPPYAHPQKAALTHAQLQRFERLAEQEGLTQAVGYALRVGGRTDGSPSPTHGAG